MNYCPHCRLKVTALGTRRKTVDGAELWFHPACLVLYQHCLAMGGKYGPELAPEPSAPTPSKHTAINWR